MPQPPFLAQIELLVKGRPWTVQSLEQLTGAELKAAANQANPHFRVHIGSGTKPINSVEFRQPASAVAKGAGIVLLAIDPQANITGPMVRAKFGDKLEFRPASPRQPADAPHYFVYQHSWGAVKFGFERSEPKRLVKLIIDAIPPE